MSSIVTSLLAERAERLREAAPEGFAAARELAARLTAEYGEYVAQHNRSGGDPQTEPRGDELQRAEVDARNAVREFEQTMARAKGRIAEIDSLLGATDEAAALKSEAMTQQAALVRAMTKQSQLARIATSLREEIDELTQRRGGALTQYGRDEIAARLDGKSLTLPKALANIDADLASRNAALVAAETAQTECAAQVAELKARIEPLRARYLGARVRMLELEYLDTLPTILPLLALLMAGDSRLSWSADPGVFPIRIDDRAVDEAKRSLLSELTAA